MRSALAIFLLVILVPVFLVVSLVTSVKTNLVRADFFKDALARERIYDLAFEEADRRLAELPLEGNPLIQSAEVQTLIPKIITKSWLRSTVESVIDQGFGWLNDPRERPLKILVDTRELKRRILSEGQPFIDAKIAGVPVCARREPAEGEFCRPAAVTPEQYREQMAHAGFDLAKVITPMADSIDVAHPQDIQLLSPEAQTLIDANEASAPSEKPQPAAAQQEGTPNKTEPPAASADREENFSANKFHANYRLFLRILAFAWLGIGVLMAAYLLLVWRGLRRTVRWAGILLFSVGLLPLAAAIASQPVVQQGVLPRVRLEGDVSRFMPPALDFIELVRATIFTPLLILGLILVSVGLAGIVGSFFLPRVKPKHA